MHAHKTDKQFIKDLWLTNTDVWTDVGGSALLLAVVVFGPKLLPGEMSRTLTVVFSWGSGFLIAAAFYHPLAEALLDDLKEMVE